MPRRAKYKQTFTSRTTLDVRGMTVEEIVNMDPEKLNRLSDADLTAISKRLVSATNKRVRRLRASKEGKYSPALGDVPEAGFSVNFRKDKNHRNRVYEEYARMRDFMKKKTSSAKGWRQFRKELHEKYGAPMDPEESSAFWRGYREFSRENPAIAAGKEGSDRLLKLFSDVYNEHGMDWDELNQAATDLYEDMQEEDAEDGGDVSSFFDDWDDVF